HAARQQRQVRFSPAAEALLPQYAWPGNVRELENTMHRVLILTQGDEVAAETIRLCLPQWRPEAANPAGGAAGIAGLAGQTGEVGGVQAGGGPAGGVGYGGSAGVFAGVQASSMAFPPAGSSVGGPPPERPANMKD